MMRKLIGLLPAPRSGLRGAAAPAPARAADTKVVLIAGKPSHGAGTHEFNAGTKLLVKCLKEVPGIDPSSWPAAGPRTRASSREPRRSSSSWTAARATR